jgi:heme a synthase
MASFRKLALASTIWTFLLIFIGGLVRATKSGLGCGTDWPHCHGELIPAFASSEVVIEYTHRAAAAGIGLLLIGLVVLALRHYRHHRPILWGSIAALGLVVFQGFLGMIVVRRELEAEIVVAHLAMAMVILALMIFVVVTTLIDQGKLDLPRPAGVARRSAFTAAAVLVLLMVGSYTTGRDAGYVFSDWPLMGGRLIPDLGVELYAIHFLHRVLAIAVGAVVLMLAIHLTRRKSEMPVQAKLAHVVAGVFALQIVIGALNVWTRFGAATAVNAGVVTLHLTLAAFIWGALVALALVSSPAVEKLSAPSPVPTRPALETARI